MNASEKTVLATWVLILYSALLPFILILKIMGYIGQVVYFVTGGFRDELRKG